MKRWKSDVPVNGRDVAAPRGVYLHVPFCDVKCPYCVFYSLPGFGAGEIDVYLDAIARESRYRRKAFPSGWRPATVYIGGGTPSLLTAGQLDRLCAMVRTVFRPAAGAEWTVECNPGSIDGDKLAVLAAAGVNRISLGAQALDDTVLRMLGRRHRVATVLQAVHAIRASGIGRWNMDLIACVPGVGERRWQTILQKAVDLEPSHVSVYALTLEEGRRLPALPGRRRPSAVMDEARQLRMLRLTQQRLQDAGYQRYEISNYARRNRRCRHHEDCWRGRDYLGLGAGAVSRLGALRRQNLPDLNAYTAVLQERDRDAPHDDEWLTIPQRAAERLVFGLRRMDGVSLDGILREYHLPAGSRDWPQPALDRLLQHGLIWRRRDRIGLSARGLEVADAVALEVWPEE